MRTMTRRSSWGMAIFCGVVTFAGCGGSSDQHKASLGSKQPSAVAAATASCNKLKGKPKKRCLKNLQNATQSPASAPAAPASSSSGGSGGTPTAPLTGQCLTCYADNDNP